MQMALSFAEDLSTPNLFPNYKYIEINWNLTVNITGQDATAKNYVFTFSHIHHMSCPYELHI